MSMDNAETAWERLAKESARLDWWFQCNERERGHVMALVHCKGLDRRAAIDQVMNSGRMDKIDPKDPHAKFKRHLIEASREVSGWPEWKRNLLGRHYSEREAK